MDSNEEPGAPPLGGTVRDTVTALVKGAIGAVPVLGSILAEVVGQIIPQQRVERLEAYARYLNDRLQHLEPESAAARLREPENVDLFEEGAFQAARALSEERKAQIAALVASGISGDERHRLESTRLLSVLREIDDTQILVLTGHLRKYTWDKDFHERHREIFEPVMASMTSDQETLDSETIQNASEAHLIRLGLLRPRFQRPRSGQLPEFDDRTGLMRASGTELTSLGRMLLRAIDVAGPEDF